MTDSPESNTIPWEMAIGVIAGCIGNVTSVTGIFFVKVSSNMKEAKELKLKMAKELEMKENELMGNQENEKI